MPSHGKMANFRLRRAVTTITAFPGLRIGSVPVFLPNRTAAHVGRTGDKHSKLHWRVACVQYQPQSKQALHPIASHIHSARRKIGGSCSDAAKARDKGPRS